MRRALIGHTGFVGANLNRQCDFTDHYNSKNFQDMTGQHFDEVTCAGIQAVKWWANQNPHEDWQGIEALLGVLATVSADRFTLISTVDVYKSPVNVDENTLLDTESLHPYGLHRLQVEEAIRAQFDTHLILRLPGLFGAGLKKNLIYDALTGGDLSGFDARSRFQFYNLAHLGEDIARLSDCDASVVNLATEPVDVASVIHAITGEDWTRQLDRPPVAYDMQTSFGRVWGSSTPYIRSAETTLGEIAGFAAKWRAETP